MSRDSQAVLLNRRGQRIYESNPSVGKLPARIAAHKGKAVNAYMMAPGTGEVLAEGAFAFVEEKIVDSEQFVKVYLDGIRQYGQLTKTGATLFELVYRKMSGMEGKDRDTIVINYLTAQQWKPDMSRRTFDRGLTELLDKEFLFSTISNDTFFVNVRFMFNGDRMILARAYRRRGSSRQIEHQRELPLAAGEDQALLDG